MPLYEYRCTACGERIEVLQRLGEAWLTECPSCHGVLERMISASSLRFKGSGFYITDYARGGGDAGGAKSEGKTDAGEATAKSEKPAATTGDAAPAAKPEGPKKPKPAGT
jgi:putative FmdB family regulatory protein